MSGAKTGWLSMAMRKELTATLAALSDVGSREEGEDIDEFADITGFHRKHAMASSRSGRRTARSADATTGV
ncbi:hypothetical protein ACVWZZ_005924 [Bradyrhizobium sp. LM6.10]